MMKHKKATSQQNQTGTMDRGKIYQGPETQWAAPRERWAPTPEEKKKILHARAKELAREPKAEKTAQESIEIVEFLLAYERYGVDSTYVREIHPLKELTPVPCTPPFVLGIVNVRGKILSVIDIKKFFDLPEKELTDLDRLIILQDDKMEFGILADAVVGVRAIPIEEIQPPLPTLTGIRADYLKGVTKERLVVLDAEKLLSDEKMIVNEEIETETNPSVGEESAMAGGKTV